MKSYYCIVYRVRTQVLPKLAGSKTIECYPIKPPQRLFNVKMSFTFGKTGAPPQHPLQSSSQQLCFLSFLCFLTLWFGRAARSGRLLLSSQFKRRWLVTQSPNRLETLSVVEVLRDFSAQVPIDPNCRAIFPRGRGETNGPDNGDKI